MATLDRVATNINHIVNIILFITEKIFSIPVAPFGQVNGEKKFTSVKSVRRHHISLTSI